MPTVPVALIATLCVPGLSVSDSKSSAGTVRTESCVSSEGLERLLVPRGGYEVEAKLPKYALSFETQLVDALRALGMRDAFDVAAADFSRMGKASQNLYVGEAIHKTFIEVNEEGTRAAAVTEMGVEATSALEPTEPVVEEVILDRPFAYLIIDYQVGLPVFMGAMARLP